MNVEFLDKTNTLNYDLQDHIDSEETRLRNITYSDRPGAFVSKAISLNSG